MAAGVLAGTPLALAIHIPWVALGVSSGAAGLTCLAVLLATRHLAWREMVGLVRRGVTS
jgi:hypothetical protein